MNDNDEVRIQGLIPPCSDWLLQNFVSLAETADLELGITLHISGFLMSGMLVGEEKYLKGIAADFSTLADDKVAGDIFARRLNQMAEEHNNFDDENEPLPEFYYIHLKQARFFNTAGKPVPGNRGVWWRGKIADVSSFFIGNLA